MQTYTQSCLEGWGRHPRVSTTSLSVTSPLDATCWVRDERLASIIPRGLGRAYGDCAVDDRGAVICTTSWDGMLSWDPQRKILECEAGVSLADIIETFLPQGCFLPTTPGTKFVTVGGAIAADIHGKNHHRVGSFGEFVEDLRLLSASGEVVRCSREENADLFFATLGGMGLTGVILSARFRLVPVGSAFVTVDYRRTGDLSQTLSAFDSDDDRYEHSVAWVDCLATGSSLGRGVVMQGNWAAAADVPPPALDNPLARRRKRVTTVPFVPPVSPLQRWTVAAFNSCFYWKHNDCRQTVDLETFFYPLDAVQHWNRLYGPRGFIQYQAFFPAATSRDGLPELLGRIAASGQASFLAVLKKCGHADGGVLSFLEPGHTLALDLPYNPAATPALCRDLDAILLRYGGRLYLAKDAMTDAETFQRMYPRLPEFQRIKRSVDPQSRFSSMQARRLGIVSP
jgi:decaprenylphospho-beta-D-ribofuranose 2-oxidase